MAILLELIGFVIFAALVVRGGVAFFQDYQTKQKKGTKRK